MDKHAKRKKINILTEGKVPPQAIELEEFILAAVIEREYAQERFMLISNPEYFYKESHQLIAKAIFSVNKREKHHCDLMLLVEELRKSNELESVGGSYSITVITNKCHGVYNIDTWCRIIQQKWMQREGIRIMMEHTNWFYNDIDVFDTFDNIRLELDKIEPKEDSVKKESALKKSLSNIYLATDKIIGKKRNILLTGDTRFDLKVHLKPSLVLIAGAGGIGKTTFTINLVKKILDNPENKKVSIMWAVLDHEDGSSIYKKFYGIDGFVSIKDLEGINIVNKARHNLILSLNEDYKKYDIEFIEDVTEITNLQKQYRMFCKERDDGRMNLLIIDNVMRLQTNKYFKMSSDRDEYMSSILADMYKENQKYNSLIFFLHHFTKEQKSKTNVNEAYQPREEHIRGSTRWLDIVDLSLFLNRPGKYDNLVANYPGYEDILKHLYILEISKQSIGDEELIYYWSDMRYSIFNEINEINSKL